MNLLKSLTLGVAGAALMPAALLAQTAPAGTAQPAPAGQAQATTGQAPAADANANAPIVGGAPMLPSRTIVENAAAASNLTTLVSAVKAAGLDTVLAGPGPFTVFAPDNDAFTRLAPGTLDTLLKPENKATLEKLLKYHVVSGTILLADLLKQIDAGGGKATLTTVEGQPLTAEKEGPGIKLTAASGNVSYLQLADVKQSNGVVHVVNGVLIPKLQ
jgi:uncharacterized surface protein with fasciclin (FAS1) repeats